jgi:hypothetical protein
MYQKLRIEELCIKLVIGTTLIYSEVLVSNLGVVIIYPELKHSAGPGKC